MQARGQKHSLLVQMLAEGPCTCSMNTLTKVIAGLETFCAGTGTAPIPFWHHNSRHRNRSYLHRNRYTARSHLVDHRAAWVSTSRIHHGDPFWTNFFRWALLKTRSPKMPILSKPTWRRSRPKKWPTALPRRCPARQDQERHHLPLHQHQHRQGSVRTILGTRLRLIEGDRLQLLLHPAVREEDNLPLLDPVHRRGHRPRHPVLSLAFARRPPLQMPANLPSKKALRCRSPADLVLHQPLPTFQTLGRRLLLVSPRL